MAKTAVITGSSKGLGFSTARGLALRGFDRIVITSRSQSAADQAAIELRESFPSRLSVEFIPIAVDLSDLHDVDRFATKVMRETGAWDLLINNAGAKIEKPVKLTKQNFEWHYGVNHLAHFALTGLLLEKANSAARVVSVSSIVARSGNPVLWSDPTQATVGELYAASKLANLVFALELNRRLTPLGLSAAAAHPGFARASSYGNKGIRIAEYIFAQNSNNGALPIIAAAGDNAGGAYFGPRMFELWGKPAAAKLPDAASECLGGQLWKLSQEQTGISFLN